MCIRDRDTTVYDFDTLEKRLREESFLNAGVKITLTDERETVSYTHLDVYKRQGIHSAKLAVAADGTIAHGSAPPFCG